MSVYFIYPFIYNVLLGFQKVDTTSFISGKSVYNGLNNYRELFKLSAFSKAIKNTLIFTAFSILFQFGIGFMLALIFNRDFPGERYLRGLLLIPWFLPLIVSANAFRFFFSEQGIVNAFSSIPQCD